MGKSGKEKGETCCSAKKNVSKHSSSTPNSNSGTGCVGTPVGGSSTPNTPGYLAISGTRSFRRSTSRGDLQSSCSAADLSDLADGTSTDPTSNIYGESDTVGMSYEDNQRDSESGNVRMVVQLPTSNAGQETKENGLEEHIHPTPTIADPPINGHTLAVIMECEDEDNCGGWTCGIDFRRFQELYANTGSCNAGAVSCAEAGQSFGGVMGATADNFLRLFPNQRNRFRLQELSMSILQPTNEVRRSVAEGDDDVITDQNEHMMIDAHRVLMQQQRTKSQHIVQFIDENKVNIEISGGSELRWMQFVESLSISNQIQERLVLKSNDGLYAYDADFGFKLPSVNRLNEQISNGTKFYQMDDRTIPLHVVRQQRYVGVDGAFKGSISPNYQVSPYSVNHPHHANFHYLYCSGDPRYCFGIVSGVTPRLTRIVGAMVYDNRPFAGKHEKADGKRIDDSGVWYQRDILQMEVLTPQGPGIYYLDAYHAIELNLHGEFIQQNSFGEVYRGHRYVLVYPTVQGATVKVSQSSDSPSLVMKLIHHCISNIHEHNADISITVEEVEQSLEEHLSIRNENFAQELRVMSFLHNVSHPHIPSNLIGTGVMPEYRHTVLDMIPDLDLQYHPQHKNISTFHHHHTHSRAHGRFLMLASDCYPYRCLMHYINTYRIATVLSEVEVLYIFRQVVCSLAVMHRHGIAHQDLSSENVLLREIHRQNVSVNSPPNIPSLLSMLCILMDYGQAAAVPYTVDNSGRIYYHKIPINATKTQPVGKFFFQAPELVEKFIKLDLWKKSTVPLQLTEDQLEQLKYDAFAVDLYQLGIFLFILIFNKSPFPTRGNSDQHRKEFFDSLRDKSFFSRTIPSLMTELKMSNHPSADCIDLMQHLLAPNPEDRSTIQEVLTHPWIRQDHRDLSFPPILITHPSKLMEISAIQVNPSLFQPVIAFNTIGQSMDPHFSPGHDRNEIDEA